MIPQVHYTAILDKRMIQCKNNFLYEPAVPEYSAVKQTKSSALQHILNSYKNNYDENLK